MCPQTRQSQPIGSTLALSPCAGRSPSLTLKSKVRFQLVTRYANVDALGRATDVANEPLNGFARCDSRPAVGFASDPPANHTRRATSVSDLSRQPRAAPSP